MIVSPLSTVTVSPLDWRFVLAVDVLVVDEPAADELAVEAVAVVDVAVVVVALADVGSTPAPGMTST